MNGSRLEKYFDLKKTVQPRHSLHTPPPLGWASSCRYSHIRIFAYQTFEYSNIRILEYADIRIFEYEGNSIVNLNIILLT